MSKTLKVTRTPTNAAAIARTLDFADTAAADTIEARAPLENERAELRATLAQSAAAAPARRDTVAEANESAARRAGEYRPRASILPTPELRARAAMVGPLFFAELVAQWEMVDGSVKALRSDTAAGQIGLYETVARDDGNGTRRVPHSPASFANALARRVATGEAFMEDISFDEPTQKGGTLAEWLFNAARTLAQRAEKGAVPRDILSADLRAALSPSGPANGRPTV